MNSSQNIFPHTFRDADYNEIPHDGSQVNWRVSIYGVCINEGKILLVKHKNEKYYDIPGGGVEMGESLEQALFREGLEEAGWQITPIRPIHIESDYFYHRGEKKFYKTIQMTFLANGFPTANGPLDPKVEDVVQVPLNSLEKYELYPNLKKALISLELT